MRAFGYLPLRLLLSKGHFRRGAVLEELKRTEEALESFKRAAELAPDNQETAERVRLLSKWVAKQAAFLLLPSFCVRLSFLAPSASDRSTREPPLPLQIRPQDGHPPAAGAAKGPGDRRHLG